MTRTVLALLLSSAFGLAACQNHASTTNNDTLAVDNLTVENANLGNTASAGAADAAFLTDAMKGDNSEVALGKIAQSKGASQGVKDLGAMLVTDNGAHKTEVATLASQDSVPATDDLTGEAKTLETKLNGLSGAAFDKAFVDAAVENHQKDIAKYEAQAKSGDPQTAALANKTLPVLKKHLASAKALQK
jgi:putative membrane protein